MKQYFLLVALWAALAPGAFAYGGKKAVVACPTSIEVRADKVLPSSTVPTAGKCSIGTSNGIPIPDPACTPGAINPSVTLDILRGRDFHTRCLRDKATTTHEKAVTYNRYGILRPPHNTGAAQTSELDHLVPLELGGADTLDNIWPQCGPPGVALSARYFKQKDMVENYLRFMTLSGRMELAKAQIAIAVDWTQFIEQAQEACPGGRCSGASR